MGEAKPSWDETFFDVARVFALRGTCLRRNFGAAIVTPDNVFKAAGYSGAPRKIEDCREIGKCYRIEQNIPAGRNYELCRSVHAEQNAIINASREGVQIKGCKMYIYGIDSLGNLLEVNEPCNMCWRVIINSGIEKVMTLSKHGIKEFLIEDRITMLEQDPFLEFKTGYGSKEQEG